jgi:hypothetical protein
MFRVFCLTIAVTLILVVLAVAQSATATSTGGCPSGDSWQLVTIESLGFDPEIAAGIPSLDGNGDGLTCVQYLTNYPQPGIYVFRDNTVQG